MNSSSPPSTASVAPERPLSSSVSPPVLAPTVGQRIWKGFGGTPWWRLIVGGLIVLIAVGLFTLPFDSLRLKQRLTAASAQQEFKYAIQKQVLERARSGLIGFRFIADDPVVVREIDDAIADIDRERAAPSHEVTVKSAAELKALIDSQQDQIKLGTRALEQAALKLRSNIDSADATDKIEQLATKIEALQENVEQLKELQSHSEAFAPSTDKSVGTKRLDGKDDVKVTINLFGKKGQALLDFNGKATVAPVNFDPETRTLIQSTVGNDTQKFIVGSISFGVLTILFLLMLIARAFAGRAAKGEQRAVIAESRERSESYARQLAEARLMVMRAQVEPHFLFNTLAHVQALQEIDPPQAGHMLERLISYLRAAMPTMRETTSTLGREVEVVTAYLDLLKIRMGDRLNYTISVPNELNAISLPPTMIATLVENAIKHGLEPKREGGTIAIQVRQVGEQIEVLVADNGLGLGGADTGGTGIGLANTRERLKMLYGDTGELIVEPNAPTGVRALLRVPRVPPAMVASDVETDSDTGVSPYYMRTVGLLALFVGWLGGHRIYVGQRRTGAVQTALGVLSILSGGVPVFLVPLLLWVVLDCVRIISREFTDGNGLRIARFSEADSRIRRSASGITRTSRDPSASRCSRLVATFLVVMLGFVGAHRFYAGRVGSAIAMIFTLGGLGIWWLIDMIIVTTGQLIDSEGKRVSEWE